MLRAVLTKRDEDILRWSVSVFLPFILSLIALLSFRFTKVTKEYREAPPLQLSYVVLQEKQKEVPKPKVKTKIVKQVVVKKKTSVSPKQSVAPVAQSTPSSSPADIEAGAAVDKSPKRSETVEKEESVVNISSTDILDNTSYSPLYNPKPSYPVIARRSGLTGYVDLDLSINKKGKVKSYTIINSFGHPSFGRETAKVIGRWRFPPPRIDGKRIEICYRYRVNFRLN